jgi:hypothetical protein
MSDERNIAFVLNSHDPKKLSIMFQSPENNTIPNFRSEFFKGHIRLMPTIFWDNSFIRLSSIIDDFKYPVEI